MAVHREVMAGACQNLGIREVKQTLITGTDSVYRTVLTLTDGFEVEAQGRGVEESFGQALTRLRETPISSMRCGTTSSTS